MIKTYEEDEQKIFMSWLKLKHPSVYQMTTASANGEKRPVVGRGIRRACFAGKKLKDMGVKAGFPDISILMPSNGYHGLFIELKRSHGAARTSDLQKSWVENLNNQGYLAMVCFGYKNAMEAVECYFKKTEV